MAEDEEIILKGSALYNYLHLNGLTNFESYELIQANSPQSCQEEENIDMQISQPVPQWTIDHLNCIIKSGLLLEDHRCFIENYFPLKIVKKSSTWSRLILSSASLMCCISCLPRITNSLISRGLYFVAISASSYFAVCSVKGLLQERLLKQTFKNLQLTLGGLEKAFVQFKKMLLLVHQNDIINHSIFLSQKEIFVLKKNLHTLLISSVQKMLKLLEDIQMVSLSVNVDSVLHSLSVKDITHFQDMEEGAKYSANSLKKLFNCYILIQSEFLRRLALCYCPEVWNELTFKKIVTYSQRSFPEIIDWSCNLENTLTQEKKFFRSVMESRTNETILIQNQGLQDILESEDCEETMNSSEFLGTIAHILESIRKEITEGQSCVERSLVQVYKMMDSFQPADKLCKTEISPSPREVPESQVESCFNPPAEDEVFELTMVKEELSSNDEDDWNDLSVEWTMQKKRVGDSSKVVLEELKTVLVKKAEEWKEREKKALESKGIPYTAPEQVRPFHEASERENLNQMDALDFLPTSSENVWPLPRLKRPLPTHRSSRISEGGSFQNESQVVEQSKLSKLCVETPSYGFGVSLLAEAIAKSREMHFGRKEDVFLSTAAEMSSGDEQIE